jgi:hypothetical protein
MNLLLLTLTKEKCGQFISNMRVDHGIQLLMLGKNGNGMDLNQ